MRKSYLKKVATKSFVGRVLRRLLGEEKGAVMMEYIVLGLLIAAAAVVAVGYFGNIINMQFATLSHATAAQPQSARATAAAAQATGTAMEGQVNNHTNAIQGDGSAVNVGTGGANAAW